jgi:hypothetical protein
MSPEDACGRGGKGRKKEDRVEEGVQDAGTSKKLIKREKDEK